MDHSLTITLCTPLLGLLVLFFIPSSKTRAIKLWTNAVFAIGFLVSLPLWSNFRLNDDYQYIVKLPWIPSIGASFNLAIDGYALLLVILTTLVGFLAVLSSWSAVELRLKEYYAHFLLLQFGMLGVFMARDFLLFFIFWELTLVPMYFIIAIWGGERRGYASIKFVIYTLIGSVIMFLGVLILYWQHYIQFNRLTFDIAALLDTRVDPAIQWPSRSPCGPSTPGSPMPTPKPPPPAPSSSPASSSKWALTASSASPCPCSPTPPKIPRSST
jgi:NADH-quinone oxidoreductase subunit M